MARYIDADKFIAELEQEKTVALEFEDGVAVYEIEHTMNLIGMQPTADVVPKREYDAVVSAVDNSTKEFLKLHDDYQEAKCELEELKKDRYQVLPDGRLELLPRSDVKALKKEVEMLQGALKAEERHNELTMEMAQKALQTAKADVAREIFEEIESIIRKHDERPKYQLILDLAELKKKYTEEQS